MIAPAQSGADFTYCDSKGSDAFWHAACKGEVEVLSLLWGMQPPGWVPPADGDNRSALHAAVYWNQPRAVHFLLRHLPADVVAAHMHPQQKVDRWDHSAEFDAADKEDIEEKLQAWMYRCCMSAPVVAAV